MSSRTTRRQSCESSEQSRGHAQAGNSSPLLSTVNAIACIQKFPIKMTADIDPTEALKPGRTLRCIFAPGPSASTNIIIPGALVGGCT